MSFKEAHSQVSVLVEQFRANEARYLARQYSEQDARNDFINKFFIALGWDVRHEIQTNPYEQEVKVEPPVKVSGAQKRADYSFSIAPNFRDPKFFVEAKKPQKDLFNKDYYFQTVRYGWHKNTPLAVLTDFEEFHILDCRFSPNPTTILERQIKRFHYSDYSDEQKFAEIYWLFSREAILNNSLEKFAEGLPKPKGKAYQKALFAFEKHLTIDDAFLEEIDGIRVTLAKAFKKNDDTLNSEELTEATQRTIDRLVFIRFLEDKLIEPEHYVNTFGEGKTAWGDFISLCARLDVKYNGIVFKRSFLDNSSFKGPVDSEFHEICQNICHLNSRFLFNEIPIHILGSIYERFLGKVVHATAKRVSVEEKPEVRKAGGVFYTPKYIVDHIVQNTVGNLIENKSPEQIAKMRFADIACGSGSFLIGVLECLLDYHNKYYQEHPNKAKKSGCIYKDGLWVLSIKQKQNILRNSIYGVDLDSQAVEVTQLSLSLKMLEDETTATANEMQVLFHEKILPDMSKNIICGNSLIETDILTSTIFSGAIERQLNPMDFNAMFLSKFEQRGFDAIVGNPPYIQQSMYEWFNLHVKNYLLEHYCSSMGRLNTFGFFVERGIKLLRTEGKLGFIIPNTVLTQEYYEKLRRLILTKTKIEEIVSFESLPFKDAVVETVILILTNDHPSKGQTKITKCSKDGKFITSELDQNSFTKNYKLQIILESDTSALQLKSKINFQRLRLGDVVEINQAIALKYDRAQYLFDERIDDRYKPVLDGREINRYLLKWNKKYLLYDIDAIHSCKREDIFLSSQKIFFRRVSSSLIATLDTKNFYALNTLVVMNLKSSTNVDIKFVLGLFNSKLFNWYYFKFLKSTKRVFSEIQARQVAQIPFPEIDFDDQKSNDYHSRLVRQVEQILNAQQQLDTGKTDRDRAYYERRCSEIDSQIDTLVYELYGLTQDEIKIVEDSFQ